MKRENEKLERVCQVCWQSIEHKKESAKYCTDSCKQKAYRIRKKSYSYRDVIREVKMNYPRLTFRLSVVGFIASIAFYLGVLRELQPTDEKVLIEQLQIENDQLKSQVETLTGVIDECQEVK